MVHRILREQAERFASKHPEIKPGYTVRVHEQIQDEEGGKARIQVFEGLVIGVHNGHVPSDRTMTVRRIASGVGVEKNFPLSSPLVTKITVKKVATVRRAKLKFLRGRQGKSARLSERFTADDEFSIAVAPAPQQQEVKGEADAPADAESGAERVPAKAERKEGKEERGE